MTDQSYKQLERYHLWINRLSMFTLLLFFVLLIAFNASDMSRMTDVSYLIVDIVLIILSLTGLFVEYRKQQRIENPYAHHIEKLQIYKWQRMGHIVGISAGIGYLIPALLFLNDDASSGIAISIIIFGISVLMLFIVSRKLRQLKQRRTYV